ncbi:sensor histidine kinase [Neolewinella persica]|uniref:sensor histidine kinase n=1 Tax=Neolewinella persica TaxID=70998 RepID=UPI000364E5B4|nr:histidine kinase dimerization/phosphoacceptor domain -containing protein [Neolewinella persica]
MRTFLTLLLLSLLCTSGRAQKTSPESHRAVIKANERDSLVFEAYVQLVGENVRKDSSLALAYLDTLGTLAAANGQPYYRGKVAYMRAQKSRTWQQWDAALAATEQAREYFLEAGNPIQLHEVDYLAGQINLRTGHNDRAFRFYQQSLEYARQAKNRLAEGTALNAIGTAHRRVGNLEESIPYYEEAIALYSEIDRPYEGVVALTNLAIVKKSQQKIEEAKALYFHSLELTAKLKGDQRISQEGYTYANLAQLFNGIEDGQQAMKYGRMSYDRFTQVGGPREQAAAQLQIATAHGRLEQYEEALRAYRKAREIGSAFPGIVRVTTNGIATVYRHIGPLDSTVYYLDLLAEQKEEAAEKNRTEAIVEMEARYQNEQKQAEIDRLALEDELNQAQISQQRWFLAGGLLLLGLLGSFIYSLVTQRRRIQAQNTTINITLQEKETLLKEIHHRVKNNLQVVSSLLSLQGEFIDDPAALDAIKMGQQRVRSMAIIHQRLYLRDETSTAISAREYLDQLVKELLGTLNVSGAALRLEKNIEDIDLDIDRLIPLGLLANEVITNAMKYAFTGRETGTLTVSFRRVGPNLELLVADDGPGHAASLTQHPESFGNLLIQTFAEQLDGNLEMNGTDGTVVRLVFPG